MRVLLLILAQVLAIGTAWPVSADQVVIDFESLTGMWYASRQPIPVEARLSDQLVSTYGVRFSSGSPYVAVVNLGIGHATSGSNGIGGSTADGRLTYAATPPLEFSFWDPNATTVEAVTDYVALRLDQFATSDGRTVTLTAYDLSGAVIGSVTVADAAGALIAIEAVGIHRVAFFGCGDDDGAALDDLSFHPLVPVGPTSIRRRSIGSVKVHYR